MKIRIERHQRAVAAADEFMAKAKREFSAAALSLQKGEVNAETKVQRALQTVEAARAALREADDAEH